uniref:Uncharacterized protein n=1 Tax=mine drainage metagenome TaxID=410659 RepID=E6QWR0_9ZZZZ
MYDHYFFVNILWICGPGGPRSPEHRLTPPRYRKNLPRISVRVPHLPSSRIGLMEAAMISQCLSDELRALANP